MRRSRVVSPCQPSSPNKPWHRPLQAGCSFPVAKGQVENFLRVNSRPAEFVLHHGDSGRFRRGSAKFRSNLLRGEIGSVSSILFAALKMAAESEADRPRRAPAVLQAPEPESAMDPGLDTDRGACSFGAPFCQKDWGHAQSSALSYCTSPRLARGRIARRKGLFRGFVDGALLLLANLLFSAQPIVYGATWPIAASLI